MKIVNIIGARPQFIKFAPMAAVLKHMDLPYLLVHTGQHYDYNMSRLFFDELGLPEPHFHLGVGSGYHGEQTGEMLQRTEEVLLKERPDWVLVYGDTNSTLAGAMAAAKLNLRVVHVEAGLRSFNRQMPEEINRVVTDHLSTLLCCPTETAVQNLRAEGFSNIAHQGRLIAQGDSREALLGSLDPSHPLVVNTGDIMCDAYHLGRELAPSRSRIIEDLELRPKEFFLATVHRAENVDDPETLARLVQAFRELSLHFPVVWPLHPRTLKNLEAFGLWPQISQDGRIMAHAPVGYFDMLTLQGQARVILTDSGGIQKEAFFAGTPCLTLRYETEWVETLAQGHNCLVGTSPEKIVTAALSAPSLRGNSTLYGQGNAAELILSLLQ